MIAIILDAITGGLWPYLVAVVGALVGAVALYLRGRSDARQKATAKAQADKIDALETRGRIEDEIDQDSNLIDRARRSGLVRRDGH